MSASREKKKRRELEAAGQLAKNQEESRFSQKTMSLIKGGAATVIALILIFVIVINSGVLATTTTAARVGGTKISPAEFNYYYWDTLNSISNTYGDYFSYFVDTTQPLSQQMYSDTQSWEDYLTEMALSTAQQTVALSSEAAAAGYTLSAEDTETIDSYMAQLDELAASYGLSGAESYLRRYYGKGSETETIRSYLEDSHLAAAYSGDIYDSFSYNDAALTNYYNENPTEFDVVSYRQYFISGSAAEGEDAAAALDEARRKAEEMSSAASNNEDEFINLALEYAPEESRETYEDPDATLYDQYRYSQVNSSFVSWLYDDERVAGETTYIESGTGYYVLYFISRELLEYNTVDVRHILIEPAASGEDGTSTTEDWTAAEEEASRIYEEWLAGDQTEESFAQLATELSADPGSAANGGLYEDVYMGQMVAEFENWCFDSSRAVGDSGIVETSYGYHIMYYSGEGDVYWKSQVDATLRNADYEEWYAEIQEKYPLSSSGFGLAFANR